MLDENPIILDNLVPDLRNKILNLEGKEVVCTRNNNDRIEEGEVGGKYESQERKTVGVEAVHDITQIDIGYNCWPLNTWPHLVRMHWRATTHSKGKVKVGGNCIRRRTPPFSFPRFLASVTRWTGKVVSKRFRRSGLEVKGNEKGNISPPFSRLACLRKNTSVKEIWYNRFHSTHMRAIKKLFQVIPKQFLIKHESNEEEGIPLIC